MRFELVEIEKGETKKVKYQPIPRFSLRLISFQLKLNSR
jgi:hypothetical protein